MNIGFTLSQPVHAAGLQVVHGVITRHLLDQAGLKADQAEQADIGAVTLIQPSL